MARPRLTRTELDALRVNSEAYFRNSVFSRRKTDIAAPLTLIAVWNRLHACQSADDSTQ